MNCADVKIIGNSQAQGTLDGPLLKIYNLPGFPEYQPPSSDVGPDGSGVQPPQDIPSSLSLPPPGSPQVQSNNASSQPVALPQQTVSSASVDHPVATDDSFLNPPFKPSSAAIPIPYPSMTPLAKELLPVSNPQESVSRQSFLSDYAYSMPYGDDIVVIRRY